MLDAFWPEMPTVYSPRKRREAGKKQIAMRSAVQASPQNVYSSKTGKHLALSSTLLFVAASIAIVLCAAGQSLASTPASTQVTSHKPVHLHKRSAAAHPPAKAAQMPPEPVAPPAPKPPDWPVNDRPSDATVVWNSQGLRIEASNSSLSQIMKDISNETGVKIQGLASDERIFGNYGPGSARDVLAQLLDGSGYNVLMIGDQGEGTPREIQLSPQPKGGAPASGDNQATASTDENSDAANDQPDQQPQPQQPPMLRNGFTPGAPPRTPQQIMQEMQQRQQQQLQQNSPQ